jgi:hypothetical protein
MAKIASHLMRVELIAAAITEESSKYFRALTAKAVKAMENIIDDPSHKDHGRVLGMAIERAIPITSYQRIDVMHAHHLSRDQEEIEELRNCRRLGVTREKMIELFGGNGLARIEALEAADAAQRARDAKVIEGEAIEVEPEQRGNEHG